MQHLFKKNNILSLLLFSILLFCLVLCILRIKDYGLSYDEILFYGFADINIHVIKLNIVGAPFDSLFNFYDLRYYGPAYLILGDTLVRSVIALFPAVDIYYAWHVLNFIVFLIGDWILFVLCRRFASELAAFFAALLYLTQPLLWGHGIMNPKDTPFMIFFLASVTLGIIAFDKIADHSRNSREENKSFWPVIPNGRKRILLLIILILLGILFVLFSFDRLSANSLSRPFVLQILDRIQNSNPESIFFSLKLKLILGNSSGISLSSYIRKALSWVNIVEFYFIGLVALTIAIFALIRTSPPYRWAVFAGVILGLTVSIRVLGPAAGGLISLYAFFRLKKKAINYLAAYIATSILIAYIFWPFLWLDPIARFIQAFRVMSNFPWGGSVRFNGQDLLPTKLPWYYLPKLLSIQFTLPLLILALAGTILVIFGLIKNKETWQKAVILFSWFFIPVLLVMSIKPVLYDNFRQFLFITPPLFVFSAVGFEKLNEVIKIKWLSVTLCSLILLPGIISGLWLHPYEYVYYNALVGWTGNIGRTYENDYYGTSLCEAGRYLSSIAKDGSQIVFTDPILSWMFNQCTDKKFQIIINRSNNPLGSPDYSVVLTRYNDDQDYFRSMKKIKTIQRGETPFLVIRSK
ncbi:MAG: hypothetical protein P4L50_12000 [Anaerolineaceae bacterium]|nr:hypothetical protein [Anaerolineaceae bacterium]